MANDNCTMCYALAKLVDALRNGDEAEEQKWTGIVRSRLDEQLIRRFPRLSVTRECVDRVTLVGKPDDVRAAQQELFEEGWRCSGSGPMVKKFPKLDPERYRAVMEKQSTEDPACNHG